MCACGGATLQHGHGLAQMPPILLSAEISSDVPQRLEIKAKSRSQNLNRSSSPRGTYPPHGLTYNNLFLFYHITCQYVTNITPLYIIILL